MQPCEGERAFLLRRSRRTAPEGAEVYRRSERLERPGVTGSRLPRTGGLAGRPITGRQGLTGRPPHPPSTYSPELPSTRRPELRPERQPQATTADNSSHVGLQQPQPQAQQQQQQQRQQGPQVDGAAPASQEPEPLVADEPLLVVARQRPAEAARFLRVVLLTGGLMGFVLLAPCAAFFLSSEWYGCGSCSRPLHIWVMVHCALHLLQSPLRLVLLRRLCSYAVDAELASHIWRLTLSRTWRLSTFLSTAAYAWLIIGIVWLLNVNFCTPCPSLYKLTWASMTIAIAKPVLTLSAFRYAFGMLLHDVATESAEPKRGASTELITKLPLVQYDALLRTDNQTSCAVCLCDYEDGEVLRRCPCGHKFHKGCIDQWLQRNKVCPLCMQDVDSPPQLPSQRKQA